VLSPCGAKSCGICLTTTIPQWRNMQPQPWQGDNVLHAAVS
jgi:hypothetical protein